MSTFRPHKLSPIKAIGIEEIKKPNTGINPRTKTRITMVDIKGKVSPL
jgi:hypothetical protein